MSLNECYFLTFSLKVQIDESCIFQVDFCQAYLIEMTTTSDNNNSIVYCVEHFIDGDYIKYNSNSGFVTDLNRLTPQVHV